MIKIAEIIKNIREELQDSDKYYRIGLTSSNPKEREIYKYLAEQELDHANRLHDLALFHIDEYKASGKPIPEGMMKVWEYEHEEFINDVVELKTKIAKI